MKIRTEDGAEIDLERLRQSLKFSNDVIVRGNHDASFVGAARSEAHIAANRLLDALEGALSIAYTTAGLEEDKYTEAHRTGFELAIHDVREAAGLIEESA